MIAASLNETCFCAEIAQPHRLAAPHPVFLDRAVRADLVAATRRIGAALVAIRGKDSAVDTAAVYNSFDFHLDAGVAKLIEINVNAGGLFLQPELREAARANLPDCVHTPQLESAINPEQVLLAAWQARHPGTRPQRIAIIDDAPGEQPLFDDMLSAQRRLRAAGLACDIVDLADITWTGESLASPAGVTDLVYNRHTDFSLDLPGSAALRAAFDSKRTLIAPNPDVWRAYADKHLLIALADRARNDPELARHILAAQHVTPGSAEHLWEQRRQLVFKPLSGFGSRGVFRGDKLSRQRWPGIVSGGYIAQRYAAPLTRTMPTTAGLVPFKADLRVWTHGSKPLYIAARLYSGQVMGMRREAEGFAPIIWMSEADHERC